MSQNDERHPFGADRFLDGFTVEERQVPVDPDSPLGRAMAEARERGIPHEPLDITGWQGTPVTFGDE
jgi:hypothetical protein